MSISYLNNFAKEFLQSQAFQYLQRGYFFYNNQVEKYFYQIQLKGYRLLSILIITAVCSVIAFMVLCFTLKLLKRLFFGIINIKANIIAFSLNYVPPIRNKLKKTIETALIDFQKQQDEFTYKKTTRMPDAGIAIKTLQEKAKKMLEQDKKKSTYGKISGCRYFEENQLNRDIVEFSKQFFYHNLLHWDMDVSIRQMEAELIALTYQLVNGNPKAPCGVVTSGGSESIFLAVLSARNYCRKHKGITQPEMIASRTIHFSFDKACSMLNIKMIKIELDPKTFQIDLKKMKRAISKRTILIAGSSPNYPHGIIDPLEEMAAIAKRKNIFFHVDCCLGSLNMPFAKELGQPVPKFDFTLDGVTSISMDHHKHGLAPKGVSIVMYKNYEIRHAQYFVSMEWPGGGYGLPTIAGSKSGAPIAGAWFAMMHLGKAGFRECAEKIFTALNYLKKEIQQIPELEIFGNPIVNTISFRSKNEKVLNSYAIKKAMEEKQWSLTGLQKPAGIHISITQPFANSVKLFIEDLKQAIQLVKNNPEKYNKNIEAEMYGSAQSLPVGQIQGFYDLINSMVDITLSV